MGVQLTWYDILDVLPGSSAEEVRRAFEVKHDVLGARRISAASSKVLTAAGRASARQRQGPHPRGMM